jgi:hypothetical protein
MNDFAVHADSNTRVTAGLPILAALFASFDDRLPQAERHGAAGRTASRSKARL